MKKKLLYLILTLGFSSCGSTDRKKDYIPEDFNYQPKVTSVDTFSHAMAFYESDTLKVGDIYRAKIFLANRHNLYDSEHTDPIIRYYHGRPTSQEDFEKGILVKPSNDTAYVKFVVSDFEPNGEKIITRSLYASVAIPLPEGDTIFVLDFPYTVMKE